MQKTRKRKQQSSIIPKSAQTPYPDHPRPDPDECRAVRDDLLSLHGFPQQFIKYRNQRLQINNEDEKESVLDGLIKTILSQNTTELNSERAFASLKSAFPTWEHVLAAESKCIEEAIRCGGLAPTKSSCIKNLLNCLLEKRGKLCMEYLRELSAEEIKEDLSQFKGIGPKTASSLAQIIIRVHGDAFITFCQKLVTLLNKFSTVSCVLMFHLQQDDFPVDTHVFQIAKTMGWVPGVADIKKTYLHLNQRIPDELKFDLNCLLYTHGKLCKKCSNRKVDKGKPEINPEDCPLLAYRRDCKVEN